MTKMNHINSCRFCGIADGVYPDPLIDKPLLENDEYFVIPSLGAMVEGWMLVVPKKHLTSLRSQYCNKYLNDMVSEVSVILKDKYGPVIMFEHGSNCDGSITGCGVNHAHLHIVPMSMSIIGDMDNNDLKWDCIKKSHIESCVEGKEYLLFNEIVCNDECDNDIYIHLLEKSVSQYFRKIIARKICLVDNYDYREYPFYENVVKSASLFNKEISIKDV